MSVIETGKAADEGQAELNIFLRGDPDDPGGTKISSSILNHLFGSLLAQLSFVQAHALM